MFNFNIFINNRVFISSSLFQKSKLQTLSKLFKTFLISFFLFSPLFSYSDPCRETFGNKLVSAQDIKTIEKLSEAFSKGLRPIKGQQFLWGIYQNSFFPNPINTVDNIDKVFNLLEEYPNLSKPIFREQLLTIQSRIYVQTGELKEFTSRFKNSSVRKKTSLMRVEENLSYWSKVLNGKQFKNQDQSKKRDQVVSFLGPKLIDELENSKDYNETVILELYKKLETERQKQLSENKEVHFISQAILDLIHTAGFSNWNLLEGMKSKDSFIVLQSIRKVLEYREHLASSLGFKDFMDFKDSLQLEINNDKDFYDTDKLEAKISHLKNQLQSQTPVHKPLETYRVRPLSLVESPFRGCLGGSDCSSRAYFEKALDPNFIYWTKTDKNFFSLGQITTVLGTAKNSKGKTIKVAFVDKIQNISEPDLIPMLLAVKESLKEEAYILALSLNVGDHNGLSNTVELSRYVEFQILPQLKKLLTDFAPHPNEYDFENGFSRAYDQLDMLEFDFPSGKEFKILAGEKYDSYVLEDLTKENLIENVLKLKDSKNSQDIIIFLNKIKFFNKANASGFSDKEVSLILVDLLQDLPLSEWKLRKRALYDLSLFNIEKFIQFFKQLKESEQAQIRGEISNWRKTNDNKKRNVFRFLDIGFDYLGKDWIEGLAPIFKKRILEQSKSTDFFFIITQFDLSLNLIQRFIESDIYINGSATHYPYTPLMWAMYKGNIEIARLMLDKGAAEASTKQSLFEVLKIVVTNRDVKMVKMFLDKVGADIVNAHTEDINEALHIALENKDVEMAKLLIHYGVDVNANFYGGTPLIYVVLNRDIEMAKMLVENGADINIKLNKKGETALMYASRNGDVEMVKLLLDRNANVHIQSYGRTALTIALEKEHTEIVKLLSDKGAKTFKPQKTKLSLKK